MKILVMLIVAVLLFVPSDAMCGDPWTDLLSRFPKAIKNSHPSTTMGCEIAIIVYRKVGTREFHYEPGSIDCWFSSNENGCNVAAPFYDPIRVEYGWVDANGVFHPYNTGDFDSIRKRQAEIGREGSFSFMDWEDGGFWYPATDIMTYPFFLPPCPPNVGWMKKLESEKVCSVPLTSRFFNGGDIGIKETFNFTESK